MIKLGDKVYHWQEMNNVGIITEVISSKNNQMTVGGTTDVRIYYKVEYENGDIKVYNSGDIQKHYE